MTAPTSTVESAAQLDLPIIAVSAADAARMVGLSRRSWWRLVSSGRAPLGYLLGKRRVWRLNDLQTWAAAGFPRRGDGDA